MTVFSRTVKFVLRPEDADGKMTLYRGFSQKGRKDIIVPILSKEGEDG
jgi:hypothetical protein